jgi:propionyl-CoA carboxylase alpha chain
VVLIDGAPHEVRVDGAGGRVSVWRGGKVASVETTWRPGALTFEGLVDARPFACQLRPRPGGMRIIHRGILADARVLSPREARLAAMMPPKARSDTSCRLVCPMPGTVVSLAVAEGQEVRTGEALCVVEAMKMENILRAERDATVRKILASPGDSLAVDAIIMEFE